MTFIDTLDEQLQTINYRFPDVLELALDTIEQVDEDAVGEVRVRLPDELTKGYNLLKRKIQDVEADLKALRNQDLAMQVLEKAATLEAAPV